MTEQMAALPQNVTVEHHEDAAPGDTVAGLPRDATLSNIGTRVAAHAARAKATGSPEFHLFVEHRQTVFPDSHVEFEFVVEEDTSILNDDGVPMGAVKLHGAVRDAARAKLLNVRVVCITQTGAQLAFDSRPQGPPLPKKTRGAPVDGGKAPVDGDSQ